MKISLSKWLPYLMFVIMLIPAKATTVQAQTRPENILTAQRAIRDTKDFQGDKPPAILKSGTLLNTKHHYFDVNVKGEALSRLRIQCVTFHELNEVKVYNQADDREVPYSIDYGFEEFTIAFKESIPPTEILRVVIKGATVRGKNTGEIVTYRIFAAGAAFGEIPLGKTLVTTIDKNLST